MKELDPVHPTLVSFCMPRSLKRYPDCCDVHLTQAYQKDAGEVRKRLSSVSADIDALATPMRHTGIVTVKSAKDADDTAEKSGSPAKTDAGS